MFYKKELIYIGQTINLKQRFSQFTHIRIDFIRFIECDQEKLRHYEKRLISYFKPKCNRHHNPNYKFQQAEHFPLRRKSAINKKRYSMKFELDRVKFIKGKRKKKKLSKIIISSGTGYKPGEAFFNHSPA